MGVYSSENRRSRLYAQSLIKPKVLAEEGGLIFARLRYNYVAAFIYSPICNGNQHHFLRHSRRDALYTGLLCVHINFVCMFMPRAVE